MVNAGMIVVQRPLSSVFKIWTYEGKAQFWSLDPGLVCLPDRRTPRPVHKLNKNSMTDRDHSNDGDRDEEEEEGGDH